MAVSKRLRFEILKRDHNTCHYCGAGAPDVKMTVNIAQTNSNVAWTEVWRYFCGVAWKTLRDRQNLARALLEAGEV